MLGERREAGRKTMTRREALRLGGAGVAGAVLLGAYGCGGGAGAGREGGGGAGSRLVIEHDAGRTTLDGTARRVAAIADEVADLLLAVGVRPAGLASTRVRGEAGERVEGSYYVDIGEPVFLGDAMAPSVEQIAALQPDLVVMDPYDSRGLYERISEVAPTLQYAAGNPGWWRRPLVDVGRATGREGRAQRFVADYDALVARLRSRAAPVVEESPRLAVLYAPDASATFVFDERGAPADPHAKLGFDLVVPRGVEIPEDGFTQVSPEVVGELEADAVVVLRPVVGEPERLPIDDLLDALEGREGGPRVLRQVIDPTRPSSSPLADKQAIEQAAELLLEGKSR